MLQWLTADEPRSGVELANRLGISRAALWKRIEHLRRAGVPVSATHGLGYRLAWPLDLLDANALTRAAEKAGWRVELHADIDSTNRRLASVADGHRRAVLTEHQHGGQGRRGRHWHSPLAGGVYLSWGFRFECGLSRLGPLSLVAGVTVAEVLSQRYPIQVGLKWPNDLVVEERKLGGILVELVGAADGPCLAIIGIGINLRLPESHWPDQPWTDLHRLGMDRVDRTELACRLIEALDRNCSRFEAAGFEPFAAAWSKRDVLEGRLVQVQGAGAQILRGLACGVEASGALQLDCAGRRLEVVAGEVSVRGC